MPFNTKEDQQQSTNESTCTYKVDTAWFEQGNKSLAHVLKLRLCEICQKKQSKKNMNKEKWENILKSIVTHCHKQPAFITPEKTIYESAFRVILANNNKPTSVDVIFSEIKKHWTAGHSVKSITVEILTALLNKDSLYGIRRIEASE
jgi:hypothetical protein